MDATGKAWVAGYTTSSLDGNAKAGGEDMFLMAFDGDGNHLWTRQRGGRGWDRAFALQAGWGFGYFTSLSFCNWLGIMRILCVCFVDPIQALVASSGPNI